MRHLWTILKIAGAVTIIWWLVSTGRLDPRNLAAAFRRPDLLLGMAALFYGQILLTGIRWHLLLQSQGIYLPIRDTLALNFIGTLFNTVIPGAVGGDVMKGYYLSRRTGTRRGVAVTTLLVDRVLGLVALLIMPLIAFTWNAPLVWSNRAIQAVLAIAAGGVTTGVLGFGLALLIGGRAIALMESLAERFRPVRVFCKVLWSIVQYQHHGSTILVGLGIGLMNHLLGIYAFLLGARAISSDARVDLSIFLLLVPLGLVTTAIPISPAGIGVGQAAFFTLFGLVPELGGRLGSEACTVFQFVMASVYLTGFVAYIFYRDQASAVAANQSVPTAGRG